MHNRKNATTINETNLTETSRFEAVDDIDYEQLMGCEPSDCWLLDQTPYGIAEGDRKGIPSVYPIIIPQKLTIPAIVYDNWRIHWHLSDRLKDEVAEVKRDALDRFAFESGSDVDLQLVDDCETLERKLDWRLARNYGAWNIPKAEAEFVGDAYRRVWQDIIRRNDRLQSARQDRARSTTWIRPNELTPWMKLLEIVFVREHFLDAGGYEESRGEMPELVMNGVRTLATLDEIWGACFQSPNAYEIRFNYDLVDQKQVLIRVAQHLALEKMGWTDRMYEIPFEPYGETEKSELSFLFKGLDVKYLPRLDTRLLAKLDTKLREELIAIKK